MGRRNQHTKDSLKVGRVCVFAQNNEVQCQKERPKRSEQSTGECFDFRKMVFQVWQMAAGEAIIATKLYKVFGFLLGIHFLFSNLYGIYFV